MLTESPGYIDNEWAKFECEARSRCIELPIVKRRLSIQDALSKHGAIPRQYRDFGVVNAGVTTIQARAR